MRKASFISSFILLLIGPGIMSLWAQDGPVNPVLVGTGTYHGLTIPLRDMPVVSPEAFSAMEAEAGAGHNRDLEHRSYPYAATALPEGDDPIWQRQMGNVSDNRGLVLNVNGQNSPYYPPDANGAAGPQHYMQSVNTTYAIYNKTNGNLVAGPTAMNELFGNVPGAGCNDGDPLILYDEQADRWLAVEFSLCTANDRMLIAVSQTDDPTGSWHTYSFDVADVPDYEKFGIWHDGYYMGTNNFSGKDIYVFERSQMLVGGTAQFVGFDNPWRPTTIDGFMCVPPVDNDGAFAPLSQPGLFITLNDDAIAGGSDQLWIYELAVDWGDPSSATFQRVQQLNVPAFDSNFGFTWDNIDQPGTNQRLDAIPQVIMNRPQYRNFGVHETIVCCHTVDVDATNHAGIRWYELRRSGGNWSIRQSGTYAPDEHSRWMGSIALNGSSQIGLAYSVSSNTVYPGIRFCGQSATDYNAASGIMDITEVIIQSGNNSQTGVNRWGDYADLCIDPANDHTFWFTSQYIGPGGIRRTKIAAFEFEQLQLAAMFSASPLSPCEGGTVDFNDESTGDPISWSWAFEGGDPSTSAAQHPFVTYAVPGDYDVQLIISDGSASDTLLIEDYIHVLTFPGTPVAPTGPSDLCSGDTEAQFTTTGTANAIAYQWMVSPQEAGTISGSDTTGTLSVSPAFTGTASIRVRAVNNCGEGPYSDSVMVDIHVGPAQFNMVADGGYCQGQGGFEVTLDGSETGVTYELFRDGTSTGISLPGYGSELSFGNQSIPGIYTILAISDICSIAMDDSTHIYYLPAVGIPATPEGPSEVCNSEKATEYMTAGAVNAEVYIWSLVPPEAGVASGNATTGYIAWNAAFTGEAQVLVKGTNNCGDGQPSAGFTVNVIAAPHPSITGKSSVCNTNTGSVYFYNTPENQENEYYWYIFSGNIVTGQGTSQVIITWTDVGEGTLTVVESSPSGCSTVADTLFVDIHDCTGIEELEDAELSLFPNPVKNTLTVKFPAKQHAPGTLVIYDHAGREVLTKELNKQEHADEVIIPTNKLKGGVYTVRVFSGDGKILYGKFIKSA